MNNEDVPTYEFVLEFDRSDLQNFLEKDHDLGGIPGYTKVSLSEGSSVRAVFFNDQIPNCWTIVESDDPTMPSTTLTHHHWALKSGEGLVEGTWKAESEELTDKSDDTFRTAVIDICRRKLKEFEQILSEHDMTDIEYLKSDDGRMPKAFGEDDISALRYWRENPFTLQDLSGLRDQEEVNTA